MRSFASVLLLWTMLWVPATSRAQSSPEPQTQTNSTPAATASAPSSAEAPVAQAPAATPPSPASSTIPADSQLFALEQARAHMERGQEFYMRGMYIESVEEFLSAYRAHAHAAFLFNAGVAYERLREWQRAITQFERYLTAEPTAPDRAEVEARIANARARLAAAQAALAAQNPDPTATTTSTADSTQTTQAEQGADATPAPAASARDIKSIVNLITINPAHASLTIRRGAEIVAQGQTPFTVSLAAGRYEITFESPQFRSQTTNYNIADGVANQITVDMAQGVFTGNLKILTSVPGARVFIDNHDDGAYGTTPFEHQTPIGRRHIWIEKPGYQTIEADIDLDLGVVTPPYRYELQRVSNGRLRVVANVRGAQVFVDGALQGVVPFEGDVPAGAHEVRVEGEDMKSWVEQVTIVQGQVTPVRVRLRPAVGRAAGWITSTVAAAILGGSIVVGVLSNDLLRELEADRDAGRLASDDARIAQGGWMAIGADAGFGLSAVFAGISLYYFLRDPLPDSEATVLEPRDWALTPTVGPSGAGGAFSVRF